MPVDGTLDLHTFEPKDVKDLVETYIDECLERGITEVRIIHGKGTGTLRRAVRVFLGDHPLVSSYDPGGAREGGEGVTIARLVSG